MPITTQELGHIVRQTRRQLGVRQQDLTLTSGTGLRFIIDLEKGKPTCQIGKALTVLQMLGLRLELKSPVDHRTDSPSSSTKENKSRKRENQRRSN